MLGSASGNTLEFNNISNNITLNIYNSTPYTVNAEDNWWGTTSQSKISEKIYDYFDYPAYGIVDFSPWLTTPYGGSCSNGIKDVTETDVDSGGICPNCSNGKN